MCFREKKIGLILGKETSQASTIAQARLSPSRASAAFGLAQGGDARITKIEFDSIPVSHEVIV
jgi:hypothetical protein